MYNPLDDVPHTIRERLSPTPSHFSIVTSSSPGPHNPHNLQEVMSPNPLSPHNTMQTAAAAATAESRSSEVVFRSMSQVTLPADLLQNLRDNISFDLGAVEDIRAALTEVNDRLNYRTNLLGQAMGTLETGHSHIFSGCMSMEDRLRSLEEALREQHGVVERQSTTWNNEMLEVRGCLEQVQARTQAHSVQVDQDRQREAMMAAKLESLEGRVRDLEAACSQQEIRQKEHHRRLDAHSTLLYAPTFNATGSGEAVGGTEALAARVDEELAKLDGRLKSWESKVDLLSRPTTDAHEHRRVEHFTLSPDGQDRSEHVERDWWTQVGDEPNSDEDQSANPWNISQPPAVPPGLTSHLHRSEKAKAEHSSQPAPGQSGRAPVTGQKEQWKVLTDFPSFDFTSKTPWELGMAYSTWKRQICTVAGTASGVFQAFVEECFAEAEDRYQRGARGEAVDTLKAYHSYPSGYGGRLVVQLLRVLPEEITAPAVEMTTPTTEIHPVQVLEELVGQVQPGGCEEQTSLTRFVRSLEAVQTASAAIQVIRRWKLARARIQTLGLPEIAPFELLRGLQNLVSRLEKRHESLRTRMSICRLDASVQLGQTRGVDLVLDNLEKELRLISANEYAKNRTSDEGDSVAHKGKGDKGKGDGGKGSGGGKGKDAQSKGKTLTLEERKKTPCPYLQKGSCSFGDRCHYKHSPANPKTASSNSSQPKTDAEKKKIPCRHHKRGGCKLGDKCKYSHAAQAQTQGDAAQTLLGVESGGSSARAAPQPKATARAAATASSMASSIRWTGSVCAMFRGGSGGDEPDTDSESSLEGSIGQEEVDSEASTPSTQPDMRNENDIDLYMAEALQRAQEERQRRQPLWKLHLEPMEYLAWRNSDILTTEKAFVEVDNPYDVAAGVSVILAGLDENLPLYDIEIGDEQILLAAHDMLIMCDDDVVRPGILVWLISMSDRNELLMAMIETNRPPRVYSPRPAVVPRPVPQARRADAKAVTEGDECSDVLLDTGANEVVRTAPGPKPARARPAPLVLADGQQVNAWRTRDGEMFVEAQEGTSTLCAVCRLIQIGVSFLWDASGAHLKMPQSLGGEWVQLEIRNGLPFLDFTQYKRLRPLLTRNWKETCMSAVSPCASEEPLGEPYVVSWEDIAKASGGGRAGRTCCSDGQTGAGRRGGSARPVGSARTAELCGRRQCDPRGQATANDYQPEEQSFESRKQVKDLGVWIVGARRTTWYYQDHFGTAVFSSTSGTLHEGTDRQSFPIHRSL